MTQLLISDLTSASALEELDALAMAEISGAALSDLAQEPALSVLEALIAADRRDAVVGLIQAAQADQNLVFLFGNVV